MRCAQTKATHDHQSSTGEKTYKDFKVKEEENLNHESTEKNKFFEKTRLAEYN